MGGHGAFHFADHALTDSTPACLSVWVRDVLPALLPHRALLCGQYVAHAAGYAAIQRHAFGLSKEYLSSITVAGHQVRSPILTRLMRTGKPQYYSADFPDSGIHEGWAQAFVASGWHNILGLLWFDEVSADGVVTVAGFYDVPADCCFRREALQNQVMPLLHACLNAEQNIGISEPDRLDFTWTPAQQAVAQYVAKGLTTKQIAKALGKSDHTVKEQLSQMMRKAGVCTRTELAIRLLANVDNGGHPTDKNTSRIWMQHNPPIRGVVHDLSNNKNQTAPLQTVLSDRGGAQEEC